MYPYIVIGHRTFGTYGLCMVLGFFLAAFCAYRKGKKQGLLMEDLCIICGFALGCALVCGSVMYTLVTYSFSQIVALLRQGEFQALFGGIVFYGGLIGGIVGAVLGIRVAKCDLSLVEHAVVPFIPLGHGIGRIGCLMAGCCYGFPYEGFGAVYYPNAVSGLSPEQGYFPVQPLESLLNVGICMILLKIEKHCRKPLTLLFAYLSLYGITRFGLEFLRGDAIRGAYGALSTSQWVSVALCVASASYVLFCHFCGKEKIRK